MRSTSCWCGSHHHLGAVVYTSTTTPWVEVYNHARCHTILMVWTRSGSTRAATPSDGMLWHGDWLSHSVSLSQSTDSTRRVRSQVSTTTTTEGTHRVLHHAEGDTPPGSPPAWWQSIHPSWCRGASGMMHNTAQDGCMHCHIIPNPATVVLGGMMTLRLTQGVMRSTSCWCGSHHTPGSRSAHLNYRTGLRCATMPNATSS